MEVKKCPNCAKASSGLAIIIQSFNRDRGSLIPMLHAVQDSVGFLSPGAMEEVASWLSIPVSEVYGVATFYTLFATSPKGKHVIRLCDSPPCHLEGAQSIRHAIEKHLGIIEGETSNDGLFTLETASCIGLCGVAPALMINQDVYGNLSPDMIPGILDKYNGEES